MIPRRALLQNLTSALLGAAAVPAAGAGEKDCPAIPALPCHIGKRGPRDGYFPDVIVTTHEGERARFYSDLVHDRVVVFNFMFTNCMDKCPMYVSNLVAVQRLLAGRIGKDIFMYSLTLDPLVDTPKVLREYAAEHSVGPGWKFLTGRPADMELLRTRLGFVDPDPERDKDRANHAGLLRYGNEKIDRWSACPALARPAEIAKFILWMFPESGEAKDRV